MIRVEKIRRNNITNNWEHWVERSKSGESEAQGYWAEGLTGITAKMKDLIKDFSTRNFNGELILYEEANNPRYSLRVRIIDVDREEEQKIDKDISELIDSGQIEKLTPVILKNLTEIYGDEIMILNDASTKFRVRASNPNPYTDMDYFWFFDNDEINENSEDVLRIVFPEEADAPLKCKVVNPSGETETDEINIKVLDPNLNSFFGRNLIKNPDASEGLKYWETINGTPQSIPIWQNPTRYGYFNANNFTVNPPELDTELTGRYTLLYFHGGSAEDNNRIVKMSQEIDLSRVEDYIDRNIAGITSVRARLFGWLGAFGYLGGGAGDDFNPNIWNEGWYFPLKRLQYNSNGDREYIDTDKTTHDQVEVFVDLLDEDGVVLRTRSIRVDETNHIQKVSLKSVVFDIPPRTRTAKIRIVFEKDMSEGTLYFRRYWEEYNSFVHDHLTMATHLGFIMDINGRTDPYLDKFDSATGRFIGETIYNEDPTNPTLILGEFNPAIQFPGVTDPEYPDADFDADVQDGEIYLTVSFRSNSGSKAWGHFWDFGDGYTSTETNPVHTYKRVGNFTVTLTTQDETGEFQTQIKKDNFIVTTLPDLVDDRIKSKPRPVIKKELLQITAPSTTAGVK